MRFAICPLFNALLISAALSPPGLRPVVSIVKRDQSDYWIGLTRPRTSHVSRRVGICISGWPSMMACRGLLLPVDKAGVSQRYFRLVPSMPMLHRSASFCWGIRLTQDSSGWGGGLYGYFKPNALVVNYATAWASTKIFLESPGVRPKCC